MCPGQPFRACVACPVEWEPPREDEIIASFGAGVACDRLPKDGGPPRHLELS